MAGEFDDIINQVLDQQAQVKPQGVQFMERRDFKTSPVPDQGMTVRNGRWIDLPDTRDMPHLIDPSSKRGGMLGINKATYYNDLLKAGKSKEEAKQETLRAERQTNYPDATDDEWYAAMEEVPQS